MKFFSTNVLIRVKSPSLLKIFSDEITWIRNEVKSGDQAVFEMTSLDWAWVRKLVLLPAWEACSSSEGWLPVKTCVFPSPVRVRKGLFLATVHSTHAAQPGVSRTGPMYVWLTCMRCQILAALHHLPGKWEFEGNLRFSKILRILRKNPMKWVVSILRDYWVYLDITWQSKLKFWRFENSVENSDESRLFTGANLVVRPAWTPRKRNQRDSGSKREDRCSNLFLN